MATPSCLRLAATKHRLCYLYQQLQRLGLTSRGPLPAHLDNLRAAGSATADNRVLGLDHYVQDAKRLTLSAKLVDATAKTILGLSMPKVRACDKIALSLMHGGPLPMRMVLKRQTTKCLKPKESWHHPRLIRPENLHNCFTRELASNYTEKRSYNSLSRYKICYIYNYHNAENVCNLPLLVDRH